jgi:hypothetical protein
MTMSLLLTDQEGCDGIGKHEGGKGDKVEACDGLGQALVIAGEAAEAGGSGRSARSPIGAVAARSRAWPPGCGPRKG